MLVLSDVTLDGMLHGSYMSPLFKIQILNCMNITISTNGLDTM